MKKVLCLLLCFLLAVPMAAGAESTRSVSWSLEGNVLSISGEGVMSFSEPFPWADGQDSITTLRVGEGITEIQTDAFRDFSALQYLALPKTLRYIGAGAFENCPGLRWVSLPNGLIGIGERAFADCAKLAPVYVPDSVAWVGDRAFDITAIINCYANSAVQDYIEDNGGTYRQTGAHALASAKGTWGEKGKWTLEEGKLTLTGTGAVSTETDGRYAWDAYRGDIQTVVLNEGITALDAGAFTLCRKLTQVTFPKTIETVDADSLQGEPVLLGYSGTAAETFAKDNDLSFTALDGENADEPAQETEAAETETTEPEAETEPTETAEKAAAEQRVPTTVPIQTDASTESTEATETSVPEETTEATEETAHEETDQPEETEPAEDSAASEETATLTVDTVTAQPGQTVTLTLTLSGNPGITGLYFGFDYDKNLLTLEDYSSSNEDFAQHDWTVGIGQGEKALWLQPDETKAEGAILSLTFRVSQNAGIGEIPVALTEVSAVDARADEVEITGISGGITVSLGLAGDVNGDGEVTNADLIRLRRYLSGQNVSAETGNADLNGDGKVDLKDLMLLQLLLTRQSNK